MAQKMDVNFLMILKMAKSAAAAHVSLPVLLRPGTRSIHIKPPLPVIWHLEGFTFSETFRPQNSWLKTRFMNSICFRYVQPTIVVVKRMLCWATPLNNQLQLSSFLDPRHARQVLWGGWDRELVLTTLLTKGSLSWIGSSLSWAWSVNTSDCSDWITWWTGVWLFSFCFLVCFTAKDTKGDDSFDVLKSPSACSVKMRPSGGVEEQAQHCQQGLPGKLWVVRFCIYWFVGLLVAQQRNMDSGKLGVVCFVCLFLLYLLDCFLHAQYCFPVFLASPHTTGRWVPKNRYPLTSMFSGLHRSLRE